MIVLIMTGEWGINFGLVLDGTEEAAERLKMMLLWDVLNGWLLQDHTEYL